MLSVSLGKVLALIRERKPVSLANELLDKSERVCKMASFSMEATNARIDEASSSEKAGLDIWRISVRKSRRACDKFWTML